MVSCGGGLGLWVVGFDWLSCVRVCFFSLGGGVVFVAGVWWFLAVCVCVCVFFFLPVVGSYGSCWWVWWFF